MAAKTCYKIHFVMTCERRIEAESVAEARQIADELATMPNITLSGAEDVRCAWNTIQTSEPLVPIYPPLPGGAAAGPATRVEAATSTGPSGGRCAIGDAP